VAFVPALGGWLVTSRALVVDVLRSPDVYTVDDPRFTTGQLTGPSMLSTDGQAHDMHRRPFAPPFRPRRVTGRFTARIDELVDDALARLASWPERTGELRAALAGPLAAGVMADMLGLDGSNPSTVGTLLEHYRAMVAAVEALSAGAEESSDIVGRGHDAMAAVARLVEGSAGGSLVGEVASSGQLSAAATLANVAVVMFGGIETTEGAILNAVRHALLTPGLPGRVAAEPGLAGALVDESLRLEPAAAVVDRYATRDATLAGVAIEAGDLVVVSLAGANRDSAEFDEPDTFRIDRPNARRHLAFATGPHVCIGLELARLQAATAVARLFGRFVDVRLGDGAPAPTGLVFRKPTALPITWSATR